MSQLATEVALGISVPILLALFVWILVRLVGDSDNQVNFDIE